MARLLRCELAGPRRQRLLAEQLGFDAVNDLDPVACAVGHARSTIQKWFDAYRLGGAKPCSRTAVPTTPAPNHHQWKFVCGRSGLVVSSSAVNRVCSRTSSISNGNR